MSAMFEGGFQLVLLLTLPFIRPKNRFVKPMANLRIALRNVHRIINTSVAAGCTMTIFSISNTQPLNIDLPNDESKRRLYNRLLYRSKQRGFLELDLVLGKWVEEHVHSMDENGIKALVHLLDLENPDLWKWLTGQEQPPEAVTVNPVFSAVQQKVLQKPQQPFHSRDLSNPWPAMGERVG